MEHKRRKLHDWRCVFEGDTGNLATPLIPWMTQGSHFLVARCLITLWTLRLCSVAQLSHTFNPRAFWLNIVNRIKDNHRSKGRTSNHWTGNEHRIYSEKENKLKRTNRQTRSRREGHWVGRVFCLRQHGRMRLLRRQLRKSSVGYLLYLSEPTGFPPSIWLPILYFKKSNEAGW